MKYLKAVLLLPINLMFELLIIANKLMIALSVVS